MGDSFRRRHEGIWTVVDEQRAGVCDHFIYLNRISRSWSSNSGTKESCRQIGGAATQLQSHFPENAQPTKREGGVCRLSIAADL